MNGDERVALDAGRVAAALARAAAQRPRPALAVTFIKRWDTNAKPAAFRCNDGVVRVVKRLRTDQDTQRVLVTDHIVAHLGALIGAPTGEPYPVEVPAALIASEAQIQHFTPGVGHGTTFVDDCSNQQGVAYNDIPQNRARFALLAVLYGWVVPGDLQLIYKTAAPCLVYSVDHGHFFPGSVAWKVADLEAAPPAAPDPTIRQTCQLTADELRDAGAALLHAPLLGILRAVASPLDEWGITDADRLALVRFLVQRRAQLLNILL